jgi:hypothetical protein
MQGRAGFFVPVSSLRYLGTGFLPNSILRRCTVSEKINNGYFDGFPYLVTRIVPALYHIILLPAELAQEGLEEIALRQVCHNRLETCLVLAEGSCVYFTLNHIRLVSDDMPWAPHYVADKLLSSSDLPETDELRSRRENLSRFIDARKMEGCLYGDLRKGGRSATPGELGMLSGKSACGVPRGLVYCNCCGGWTGECLDPNPFFRNLIMKVYCRCENDNLCARCGQQLYEYRLNANYFGEDGEIWHVPGFGSLSHRCPDMQRK